MLQRNVLKMLASAGKQESKAVRSLSSVSVADDKSNKKRVGVIGGITGNFGRVLATDLIARKDEGLLVYVSSRSKQEIEKFGKRENLIAVQTSWLVSRCHVTVGLGKPKDKVNFLEKNAREFPENALYFSGAAAVPVAMIRSILDKHGRQDVGVILWMAGLSLKVVFLHAPKGTSAQHIKDAEEMFKDSTVLWVSEKQVHGSVGYLGCLPAYALKVFNELVPRATTREGSQKRLETLLMVRDAVKRALSADHSSKGEFSDIEARFLRYAEGIAQKAAEVHGIPLEVGRKAILLTFQGAFERLLKQGAPYDVEVEIANVATPNGVTARYVEKITPENIVDLTVESAEYCCEVAATRQKAAMEEAVLQSSGAMNKVNEAVLGAAKNAMQEPQTTPSIPGVVSTFFPHVTSGAAMSSQQMQDKVAAQKDVSSPVVEAVKAGK